MAGIYKFLPPANKSRAAEMHCTIMGNFRLKWVLRPALATALKAPPDCPSHTYKTGSQK